MYKNEITRGHAAILGLAALACPLALCGIAQADFSLVLQDVGTSQTVTLSQQAATLTPNSSGGVVVPISVGSFSGYFTGDWNSAQSALESGGLNISNAAATGTSDTLKIYWSDNNLAAPGHAGSSVSISQSGGGTVVEGTGSMSLETYIDPSNSVGLPGSASYTGAATASFSNASTAPQPFTLSGNPTASLPLQSGSPFAFGQLITIHLSGGGAFAVTNGQFGMNNASTIENTIVTTPEPASLVFIAMGGLTLLARRRKVAERDNPSDTR